MYQAVGSALLDIDGPWYRKGRRGFAVWGFRASPPPVRRGKGPESSACFPAPSSRSVRQISAWTPASSWRAITIRWTWLVPS